ncbi:MAG: HNH endonuclease [Prevotellaceae bacterium]|jgi:hypothetical protein|nr:HNH endonuclease [Prevotellaceae bacterium]
MGKGRKSLLQTIDIEIVLPNNPPKQRKLGDRSLLTDLTDEVLEEICVLIFRENRFTKKYQNRQGRYIEIRKISTDETHFVCISNPCNDARNAFLMQFIPPAFAAYYSCQSKKKKLDIYILKDKKNYKANYNKLFYRIFLTIGVNILNLNDLQIEGIAAFSTYEDIKRYRKVTSERNSHNNSTYFSDDENQISIFGKTFGANAMESFLFALTISKIVSKPIVFYPVIDNESDNLSLEQQHILTENNVAYSEESIELADKKTGKAKATSRNQNIFKYNLLNKFGDKHCYLCGCDIENLIIASHIERVTDIDNNSAYTQEEKIKRSTDGDNGLWLCANHDKMFESGAIYFETDEISTNYREQNKNFLDKSIYEFRSFFSLSIQQPLKIQSEHYNNQTKLYLQKHFQRVEQKIKIN